MKRMYNKLRSNPKYSEVFKWGKLISLTGSVQLLVQASGLLTGILIIRMLPTQEYAYYTLANTMLGTMTILADGGGIGAGVMALGGKVWKDKTQLGVILSTGLSLRNKFALISLFTMIPILVYLMTIQGAGFWVIFLVVVAIVPAFYAALSDSLLEIIPKLHQDIKPLQGNQAMVGILRLALTSLSVFIFPFTFVALLANGISRMFGNVRLRKIALNLADGNQPINPVYQAEMLQIVKKTLPGAIYYCLSGQITIWLISIFGSTVSIAQIGALGRLSMFLTVFSALFSTLIIPRYARLMDRRDLLLGRFLKILAGLFVLGSIIIGFVYSFPQQILWILGKNYSSLSDELILSVTGSCLGLISGSIYGLMACRGYIITPAISIPINLGTLTAAILFFDVGSIQGILLLNILVATVQIVMLLIFFLVKICRQSSG